MDFRILGTLEVVDDHGGSIAVGGPRRKALLALLLLRANEVVSSDALIDELWAGEPPDTATAALQVHVSGLRKALGDRIVTKPPGYLLRVAEGELDAERFEGLLARGRDALAGGDARATVTVLGEALATWRGPPLCDFAFEPWAQTPTARLEELRLTAIEDRVAAELALGRHHDVIAELEALVAEQPLRERLRRHLMVALYRCGRHADALEVYREGRTALVEELGMEPSRDLQDLERAILVQDPALDLPAPVAEDARRPPSASGPFVGRQAELTALAEGLEHCFAGRGRLYVISGDPGIGKSALAGELAALAFARGALVLVGHCWEAGGAPAYWPWIQVLRAFARSPEGSGPPLDLGSATADVAQLVPELEPLLPSRPEPPPIDPAGARFRLFESVTAVLRSAAARRPLVLLLDDLHAGDAPSLLLLLYLAASLDDARILVVATYRDVEVGPDHPLGEVLAELGRQQPTRRLSLRGLPRPEVGRLLELTVGMTPPDALVGAIELETDGNPLFIGEMARLLASEGRLDDLRAPKLAIPPGVRSTIDRRLRHLSAGCKDILTLAAVFGREFDLERLQRMGERPLDDLLELLDEAVRARVVEEASTGIGRFRFSHGLIREALYGGLTSIARMRLHSRAGDALEQLYADAPGPHLAELAHHCFAALPAGDATKAVDYARRAGRHAMELSAFEEAARLFGMALAAARLHALPDDEHVDLLIAAGEAQTRSGDAAGSKEILLEAAEEAERLGLHEQLARAALAYGGLLVYARAGGDTRLIPLLERALDALGGEDSALRARLLARLAGAMRDMPSPELRGAHSAEAVAIARRLGDPATLAYALDGRWAAIWLAANPQERLDIAGELVAIADEIGDKERAVESRTYRHVALTELGDPAAAADAASQLRLAHELRQPVQLWLTYLMQTMPAIFEGRLDAAEELIEECLRFGERAYGDDARQSSCQQLFALRREQGRLAEVAETIEAAAAHYTWYPLFQALLAWLYTDLGRLADAQRVFAPLARDDFSALPRDNTWQVALAGLSEVCVRLDDRQAAATLYELQLPFADRCALTPEICVGAVSRYLGMLAAAMARWGEATEHFDAALALNAAMGGAPWVAHTQVEYARMLLARDEPGDEARALELLDAACETYRGIGMESWAERAAGLRRAPEAV